MPSSDDRIAALEAEVMSDSDSRISALESQVAYLNARCGLLDAIVGSLSDEVAQLRRGQSSSVRAESNIRPPTSGLAPWAVGIDTNAAVKGVGASEDEKDGG